MANLRRGESADLFDVDTGEFRGVLDGFGREQMLPTWSGTALVDPQGVKRLTPVCPTNGNAMYSTDGANRLHATNNYNVRGYDPVDRRIWVIDTAAGFLRQYDTPDSVSIPAFGVNKTWPTDVAYTNVQRLVRFKSHVYLLGRTTADTIYKVFRASPTAQGTAFTWSAALHQMTDSNSTALVTSMEADESYIYLAEYGDPGAGPRCWRSADGETWETIYGPDATLRHIHHIMPDPYQPGHVYMTCGDGVTKTIQRSTDYGATWAVVVESSRWQAVQISFTETAVYFAGDSQRGIVWYMDRDELVPRWLTMHTLPNVPPPRPAAVSDQFYGNAWYGAVDPASGVYYAAPNDNVTGNTAALLAIAGPGAYPATINKYSAIQTWVLPAFGFIWVGTYRHNPAV